MRAPALAADGRVVVPRDPSTCHRISPNVSSVEHQLRRETPAANDVIHASAGYLKNTTADSSAC